MTPPAPSLIELKKRFLSQITGNKRRTKRPSLRLVRPVVILAFIALATMSFFFSSSSALSFYKTSRPGQPNSLSSTGLAQPTRAQDVVQSRGGSIGDGILNQQSAFTPKAAALFPALMPQATTQIATFSDSGHNTPQAEFALGNTIYTKAAMPGGSLAGVRIAWIDPDGFIRHTTVVTSNAHEDQFGLPGTPNSSQDDTTLNNVGRWRVNIISKRGRRIASTEFTVADPNNAVADLAFEKTVSPGNSQVPANAGGTFDFTLINRGPSDAVDVELVDTLPANTSFVSINQTSGAAFECANTSGTVRCTIESFPRNTSASFILSYNVSAGTAVGTVITNTASVSSATNERNTSDNTSTATASVAAGGSTCSLTCPEDVSVNADTTVDGVRGKYVTFSAAEPAGDCGTISASPASGSFFPVGTHTVSSTSGLGGGGCSFTVTVHGDSAVAIACAGNITASAPSGSCEAEVSVTAPATTPSGLPTEGVRNDGQALTDKYPVGTTTITWTATDASGNTATCAQTVTVTGSSGGTSAPVITAPPAITTETGTDAALACGAIIGESALGTPEITGGSDCSVEIKRTGVPQGNFFPVGTTTITYTATNSAGLTGTATQTVTVTDNAPPLITLNGDDPNTDEVETATVTMECGSAFTDPGATAKDSCEGVVAVAASSIDPQVAGTQTITYTATDSLGNTSTATRTVILVDTTAPTITLNGGNAPITVECHSTFVDPGATAQDGCAGEFPATASGVVDVNTPGTYTITYSAADPSGNAAPPVTRTVNVVDTTAPTISCPTNITAIADQGSCSTAVNFNVSATDACSDATVETSLASGSVFPLGTTTVNATATDAAGNTSSCSFTVTVTNPNPVVTLTGPQSGAVYPVNTPVSFTGTYTDAGGGTHTAQWMFDALTQTGTVTEPSGSTPGTVSATYSFTTPGVYFVKLTVNDSCGGTAQETQINGLDAMVVIYDPNGGFVTGGGWINSPAGSYVANPSLIGKANFGFVSKYKKGATIPTGQTEFQFKAGSLNFSSTNYEWLVVAGARAKYKGVGTINGSGNYGFMLTAIDGQVSGGGGTDKFRIKIWDKNNGDAVVYDNQMGAGIDDDPVTVLGGGSIVIHH